MANRDFITFGNAPYDEDGGSLPENNGRESSSRFIKALRIHFGEPPEGARLCVKGSDHDFGRYYEAACEFDDSEEAFEYAHHIEANIPATWEEAEQPRVESPLKRAAGPRP